MHHNFDSLGSKLRFIHIALLYVLSIHDHVVLITQLHTNLTIL